MHADNMTFIPYQIQNYSRQGWTVRIKVWNCLKTTLMIGKGIHIREPVGSRHFGKIKLLVILNSYFIKML